MTPMSDTASDTALELERWLAATPDRVFRAWTDPEVIGRWMSPVGHAEAEVDLRPGGCLRVTMVGDGVRIEHHGRFLAVEPPHRLVFTWRSPYTGDADSRVSVALAPDGDGTRLTLRHELLPPGVPASHRDGWGRMLARLADVVADTEGDGHGPG